MNSSDGNARMGKSMIVVAWVLLLALLTYLFNMYLSAERNPNQNLEARWSGDGSAEVVLERNRGGHYVADGFINDHPVTFLIDTGATDVAVPDRLADHLELRRDQAVSSQTANGVVTAWSARLDSVRLGPIEMRSVRATVLPNLRSGEVLLGMSFLKHLELVQRGEQLTLRVPERG